jgi:hypothetical protein
MTSLLLVLALLAVGNQSEEKKIPKDSVQISAPGCLKGRVFTATPRREGVDVVSGPDVTGRHFRLAGPKDVMKTVKENDGRLVEVVGLVRKAALSDQGLGMKVGGSRVIIGAPGGDPTRMNAREPVGGLPVMDISSVRMLADSCPIE